MYSKSPLLSHLLPPVLQSLITEALKDLTEDSQNNLQLAKYLTLSLLENSSICEVWLFTTDKYSLLNLGI
jgi:hypothetical protein